MCSEGGRERDKGRKEEREKGKPIESEFVTIFGEESNNISFGPDDDAD